MIKFNKMDKATIEFDLSTDEGKMALQRCLKSTEMAQAIFELKYNFRSRIEGVINTLDIEPESIYEIEQFMETVFDEMHQILKDINTEELIQ